MKFRLLVGAFLLAALPLRGQTTTNSLTSLSPEFQQKMKTVFEAFSSNHYDEALARLQEAEKMHPDDAALLNLQGSILVKQEKWTDADACFVKALQIDPKFFPARFNRAEVLYLQKKYPEARAAFQTLAEEDAKNELLQYKIYLTYLMEGNLVEAEARLDKFDFSGNTPAYYYAHAAWLFKQGKTKDAEDYIRSSLGIFSAQSNNLFAEPLIDADWLQRRTQDASTGSGASGT